MYKQSIFITTFIMENGEGEDTSAPTISGVGNLHRLEADWERRAVGDIC